MSEKKINASIQLLIDTEANWLLSNIIPKRGELVVYATDENHTYARVKIGDGITPINDLSFISSHSMDTYVGSTQFFNSKLDFVPEKGSIVVYTDKATNSNNINIPGIKVGDGNAYCVDLPFIGEENLNLINAHISDTNIHVSSEEKAFWNNKLNLSVSGELLTFNRE